MLTASCLRDIACSASNIDCNLTTTATASTTDKLNSSTSFLITDILTSNNGIDETDYSTSRNQFSIRTNSVQEQNQQQHINENNNYQHYDKKISVRSFINSKEGEDIIISNSNENHVHLWQFLFDFLLSNSSMYTEQSDSLISPQMSRNEFLNILKEKIQINDMHTISNILLQLNKEITRHPQQQQFDNISLKLNVNLDDIHSLKHVYRELWRLIQENSTKNNNSIIDTNETENSAKTIYNELLHNSNTFKLFWTKSNEQYAHQTLKHLKQTENSTFFNESNNHDNKDDIYIKSKSKKGRESEVQKNSHYEEEILENMKTTQIDKLKAYQLWFNSMQCVNTQQQKLYNLYKTNYLLKGYCKSEVENLKTNENYLLKFTNITSNDNDNNNTSNSNVSSNNNNSRNIENDVDTEQSNVSSNLSITPNSALDALIHMTTSTMKQLKHDGDFSDELHETSAIQFYNKVSQTRKRRKTRTTFSNCQLNELENNFNRQRY
ncbi:Homeobox protein [Schistosoma japonicum]|uniref:Homeobox protein n=1 Tax=Schistosoma japonicum TaxID=6182 RepID=A0A4Z2DU05_SCHJA|nr:Homeobox protein [Schistosoma japonicum]